MDRFNRIDLRQRDRVGRGARIFLSVEPRLASILLVVKQGVSRERNDTKIVRAMLEFQFWNRRKYPVTFCGYHISFPGYTVHGAGGLIGMEDTAYSDAGHDIVEPSKFHQERAEWAIAVDDDKNLKNAEYSMRVYYFDPIANERRSIVHTAVFMELEQRSRWRGLLKRLTNRFSQRRLSSINTAQSCARSNDDGPRGLLYGRRFVQRACRAACAAGEN